MVCCAGPARATQVIREALARGADRAIHVESDALAAADAATVAEALASAIKDEQFDLVLTGLQSDDQGFGQVGVVLAEKLGMPHATIIMDVQVQDGGLRVKRELEGGWFQWVALPMPALLTIQSGINQLRYATLKGIMAAKKKRFARCRRPAAEPLQQIRRSTFPKKAKQTQLLSRSAGRRRQAAGREAARRGQGAPMSVLVIAEQRGGTLNRATWETIAAAQQAGGPCVLRLGPDEPSMPSRRSCRQPPTASG